MPHRSALLSSWRLDALAVCGLVLAAALLRAWHLDGMSIWQDEGLSLYRATRDLAAILSGIIQLDALPTRDVQPPLYFLLLAAWFRLLGESTWLAKWLSLAASLPAVPLVWGLGRRWLGRAEGLVAAALVALSPAYLWYSQEIRSYSLGITLGLLAVYCLTRMLDSGAAARGRWAWAAGAAMASGLLLWTHYLGFFIVLFEALWLLTVALRQRRRWLLALLALLLLLGLPLLPFAWGRLQTGVERHQVWQPPQEWLLTMLGSYGMGRTMPPVLVPLGLVLFAGLVAAGCWGLWHTRRHALWLVLGYLLVPTAAFFALSFVKPAFRGVQHLLLQSPAFYLLVAAGLVMLANRRIALGATAGGLAIAAMLVANVAFYTQPDFAKDDLRALAEYVDARAVPGDILALSDPVLALSFQQLVQRAEVRAIPPMNAGGAPLDRPPQELLAPLLAGRKRLWFMTPGDTLKEWLAKRALLVDQQRFHGADIPVRLDAYERPATAPEDFPPRGSVNAVLGGLKPLGFEVLPNPLEPGRGARVRLAWQVYATDMTTRTVSLRLLDAAGQVLGQSDTPVPAADWPYGEVVYWPQDLPVSPGAAPGRHRLAMTVYDAETGQTWPEGEPLVLGEVMVDRPAAPIGPAAVAVGQRLDAVGGGLRLFGVDLPALGDVAGAEYPLAAWLQADRSNPEATILRAELVDAFGRTLATADAPVAGPDTPLTAGDLRRVPLNLHLPADAGRYGLRLRALDADGDTLWLRRGLLPVRAAALGPVDVSAPRRDTTVPPMAYRADATVGDSARLLGYDLPMTDTTAGADLPVTLYWRAETRTPTAYRVTVQLVPGGADGAAAGAPVAQHDGIPADGQRPTTSWVPGEVLTDPHTLALPADLAPGDYLLIAALYDPADPTAPRPAVDQGGRGRDYAVLQPIRVRAGTATGN